MGQRVPEGCSSYQYWPYFDVFVSDTSVITVPCTVEFRRSVKIGTGHRSMKTGRIVALGVNPGNEASVSLIVSEKNRISQAPKRLWNSIFP
jgi:N6-adenosine-specific RNA methylase IME4